MIRIFISIIVYLITLLTQAQSGNTNHVKDKEVIRLDDSAIISVDCGKQGRIPEKETGLSTTFMNFDQTGLPAANLK